MEKSHMTNGLFSSRSDEWETPWNLFNQLNAEFHFNTDVCATPQNKKCAHFYSKDEDGLKQSWRGNCWMNPPYGRVIKDWVEKACWDVGVACQDGRMFHGPCHLRINLALPLSRVQEAFERMDKYVFNA